jgi:hypothetical protein
VHAGLFSKGATMNSEIALDYRFAVKSPADAHYSRVLSDLFLSEAANTLRAINRQSLWSPFGLAVKTS